jgi:hypothetical protein
MCLRRGSDCCDGLPALECRQIFIGREDRLIDPEHVEPIAIVAALVFDGDDTSVRLGAHAGDRPAAGFELSDIIRRLLVAV